MEALPEHTIDISGLKDGTHRFHFTLGPGFFGRCGVEEFLGGQAEVEIAIEKSSHLIVSMIHVDGHIDMLCDHCNAPMQQAVEGDQRQIFKLTGEDEGDEAELVSLDPGTTEINFTHYLFECISLHLPIRHVHPAGQCDPAVADALERVSVNHGPDPRWAVLNDLKNKGA